jgi:phosphonoacetate hydrolase
VPFIVSHPMTEAYRNLAETRRLRNFDIFDFALNGVGLPATQFTRSAGRAG